jgi:hypothetical protein
MKRGFEMRSGLCGLTVALVSVLCFTPFASAQTGQQAAAGKTATAKAQPFDPHDLSGVWWRRGKSGSTLSRNDVPPMTPWAQAKYAENKPGIGRADRVVPLGNDPMMACDPVGFPRISFYDAYPTEIIQVPGRVLIFFDYFYAHRTIWTDGRELPKDPDPTWYGVSVGKWEGDTFVVETVGFNDRTWIDDDGHPHSEDMRVEERYRRVDHDTIELNMTITDPKAYTKPWVGETKTWRLDPKTQLREDVCVPSDEAKYKEEMRVPAATPIGK